MRYLPISLDLSGKRVVIAGDGAAALAKLRLLAKTDAQIAVFAADPLPDLARVAARRGARLTSRRAEAADIAGATLVYAASGDRTEDDRIVQLARVFGALANGVDWPEGSDFLTPAIVDRDPVTVAIGTEGAAPVLARRLKASLEAGLPQSTGALAAAAQRFRPRAAALPSGKPRRRFWDRFFGGEGARAHAAAGPEGADASLEALFQAAAAATPADGHVHLVGAGPGDPELLTLKARRLLHDADVVVYDRLAATPALELARREATLIEVGKIPGGPSWAQDDINALMIEKARAGLEVVRLKSGDPAIFGRLDEETDALAGAGVAYSIVPGVTAATAAAAAAGLSLTRRGRNSAVRILTGHDVDGFAEHDWRALAAPGAAAAIYMGVGAAAYLQGRLLMHGADPETPCAIVENASRPNQKIVATGLAGLAADMRAATVSGPAILFLGVAPPAARALTADPAVALR